MSVRHPDDNGMALIVTLAVVAVVLAGALELNRLVTSSAVRAYSDSDQFLAGEKAMAGIHFGMAVLVQDARDSKTDSIQEDWADDDKLAAALSEMGYTSEELTIHIEDELGKIQMNALIRGYPGHEINWDQKYLWYRFLTLNRPADAPADLPDTDQIINCAKDWLDSLDDDAVTGLSGAETDEYLRQAVPITCTNGPFEHPREFYALKDVTPAVLAFRSEEVTRIGDVFTVYGLDRQKSKEGKITYPGRINLNTAKLAVLEAVLPEGMELRAGDLVDYRGQKGSKGETFINVLDKGWAERVIEFSEKEMDEFDRLVTYASHTFSITSTARQNQVETVLKAVVQREEKNGWTCRIIQILRES